MSDIDTLREMIKPSAMVQVDNQKVRLTEPKEINCYVDICGMPEAEDVIVIKADEFKAPNTVFHGSHGECKRSDFVIIAKTDKKKVIICIELKKTKDNENGIIQQLRGSKCFVEYCKQIVKEFRQESNFLKGYEYRFVAINHISIAKKRTRVEPRQLGRLHDAPERMLKISSPNRLEFNHLAGRPRGR